MKNYVDFQIADDQKERFQKLDKIINQYYEQEGMLIRILQKAQDIFGYLPVSVQSYISYRLNIPISTVSGVVSFYSLFSEQPRGKYVISVCLGTACYVKGARDILNAIKDELQVKEGETTMDGLFTIETIRCIGACGLAPVILINDEVYAHISPDDIPGVMHKYKKMKKAHKQ